MWLSVSITFLASLTAAQTWSVGETVKTSSGSIKGHASSWKPGVSEYLGVPFAEPPVGSLRFMAPKLYKSDKTVNAADFGFSCPANIETKPNSTIVYGQGFDKTLLSILSQAGDKYDEDCLTLNIWTKPQSGQKKKAVMIWIYGGGFNSGNSRSPTYNGARLADEYDVVVVSLNYRANIFGFPRADFLSDRNVGLLDQRLGVEWIRDNIDKFGGDPSRMILFGQSAGGVSVDYYSYAWTKDPIVRGFIAESGSAGNIAGGPNANLSAGWYMASQKLGCGGIEAGSKTLACMQSKPWASIMANIEKRGVTPNMGAGGFGPEADEKLVFSNYTDRKVKGKFIHAPLIVGNADNEGGFYQLLAKARGQTLPSASSSAVTSFIGCGPHSAAEARMKNGVPAWRYVYQGVYPNQDIGIPGGAWHGSEIALVFGTSEFLSHLPDSPEEVELGEKLRKAWTAFAKDPAHGLDQFKWPTYDANKPSVIHIGGVNSSAITFEARPKLDAGCGK